MPKQTAVRGRRSLRPGIAPVQCGLRRKQGDAEFSGGQLLRLKNTSGIQRRIWCPSLTHTREKKRQEQTPPRTRARTPPPHSYPKKAQCASSGAATSGSRSNMGLVAACHGGWWGATGAGRHRAARRKRPTAGDGDAGDTGGVPTGGWATAIGGGGALRWGRQPEWRQRATGRQRSPVDDGRAADSCGAALVAGSFWR